VPLLNRHALKKFTANSTRWLHIYLSMFSFGVVFFFALTGITLNHPDRFAGQPQSRQIKGQLKKEWLQGEVAKLEIVEYFRATHAARGALSDFRIEPAQCAVSFKGPAYAADAFIDRTTGAYDLTITTMGTIAIWNDLHKGRDTGAAWAWLIDVSAVLLILVSLTGTLLLWFVHRRRTSGYLAAGAGALMVYAVYRLWVP